MVLERRSPDGRWNAVVFVRNCGATTDFSTHVSVLPAGTRLGKEPGNALVIGGDHKAVSIGVRGEIAVSVKWLSRNHLAIEYPPRCRVFKQSELVRGLSVTYKPVDAAESDSPRGSP
jgi:hypothetical protein